MHLQSNVLSGPQPLRNMCEIDKADMVAKGNKDTMGLRRLEAKVKHYLFHSLHN